MITTVGTRLAGTLSLQIPRARTLPKSLSCLAAKIVTELPSTRSAAGLGTRQKAVGEVVVVLARKHHDACACAAWCRLCDGYRPVLERGEPALRRRW
jgi:hypothetical protein